MTALAKVRPGLGGLELVDRPRRDPGVGEVVLEVLGAGICGTDLHIEQDEFPSDPPVTLGHEISGIVTEVGPGTDQAWIGRRVVSENMFTVCGECHLCISGHGELCLQRRSLGVHEDGAFASEVVVPVANLHSVSARLEEHAAALIEPLACVCKALLDPDLVAEWDSVLVAGPGPIGILAAQIARLRGAEVTVLGRPEDRERLAVATELGLSVATTADWDATDKAESVDAVIECSGAAAGLATCIDAVRRRGRYVQIGLFGRSVELDVDALLMKEVQVDFRFSSSKASWRRAVALVEAGEVRLDPLVSAVVRLEDWDQAFADLRDGHHMKVVFDPRIGAQIGGES